MKINNRLFSGERPKLDPRNLNDNEAQIALDCELSSGGIRAMFTNRFVKVLPINAKTIYHMEDQWLSWDSRVAVAESPVGIDRRRLFWTGDGAPKQATVEEFNQGRSTWLGVPTPAAPSIVSVSGNADEAASTAITTLYTVSFINRYGDEGDMSPPSALVNYLRGQIVTIANLGRVPGNTQALRKYDALVGYRIYRLDEGESRFVAEQRLSFTDYSDNTSDMLGDTFQTADFVPPPEDMQGIHIMANGVGVGFVDKTVYLTEPNKLNAWPYNFPVRDSVVAVSSFDNTLVIGTTGYPEVASVYDPRNVSPAMLTEREPCVSQFSMVQGLGGVMYASPSCLFYVGPSGGKSLSNDFMDDRDWRDLKPETIHAIHRDGEYYAFHEGNTVGKCWIFDTRESNAIVRRLSQYADAAHVLRGSDTLYLSTGQRLEQFQGGSDPLRYRWLSKEHGLGNPVAMTSARALSHEFLQEGRFQSAQEATEARAQAEADLAATMAARLSLNPIHGIGGAINQGVIGAGGLWDMPGIVDPQPLGAAIANGIDRRLPSSLSARTLFVKIYRDRFLIDETEVLDEEPFRLAYADRSRRWAYELEGEIDVSQFDMAGSASEIHYGS